MLDTKKIEVRDQRKGNWVWVQTIILFSAHVSAFDYKVYSGLASYAGNRDQSAWPGVNTLAQKLNVGRATVLRSLKNLEEAKVIKIERRPGTSNIYYLLDIEVIEKPTVTKKQSPHHRFIDYFFETAQRARGIKIKLSIRDVTAVKRALDSGIDEGKLEMIALYFLADDKHKHLNPSISVMLSAGVLNGLLNEMQNDPGFWRRFEMHTNLANPGDRTEILKITKGLAESMAMNEKVEVS